MSDVIRIVRGDKADGPGSEVLRLRELDHYIRWVVTQQADDLCWMDVYRELGRLVCVPFDPLMLSREQMLAQCGRYVDSLLTGCPYATDKLTARLKELEAENAVLRDRAAANDAVTFGGLGLLAVVVAAVVGYSSYLDACAGRPWLATLGTAVAVVLAFGGGAVLSHAADLIHRKKEKARVHRPDPTSCHEPAAAGEPAARPGPAGDGPAGDQDRTDPARPG